MLAGAVASVTTTARAQGSNAAFERWVAAFRARARARGISEATYTQVMSNIKPDTKVFELIRSQPEFNEQLWQYLNRRVSDWRITTGREKAKEFAPLLERIENDYGVDRWVMLGVWGIELAFGDPDVQKNHMRPVIPALAALAWGEPRRRSLLGTGVAQRAHHHRAGLEHASGDARLLGGGHGPYAMDAGGLAQCRARL